MGFLFINRNVIFCTILFVFIVTKLYSQTENVGIGTTSPDNSAILELFSTSKGFLMPRLTSGERDAVASPATGLLIYNTTTTQYEYNVGTPASPSWIAIASTAGLSDVFGSGADGQVTYWNSSSTITGSNNLFYDYTNTRLGIGNNTARERLDLVDGSSIGAIILGDAEAANAGTIRWDGSDFFGHDGSDWVSLTSSSTITGNGTANQITFWSGAGVLSGENDLVWDAANNRMGIGTSSPTSTVSLDVIGNIRGEGGLEVTGETSTQSITLLPLGSAPSAVKGKLYYNNSDDQLKVYDGSAWNNLGLWSESSGDVYRETGDVAIGRTSPRDRLDIQDGSGDGAIIVGNTVESNDGTIRWSGFDFEGYTTIGGGWVSLTAGGGGGGGSSTITGFGSAGQVTIWSSTSTLMGNSNLYWNNVSGWLGIGDDTPDHMLDVAGNIGLNNNSYINFGDDDGLAGYGFRDNAGTIEFKDNGGSWSNFNALSGGDVFKSGLGADGYIAFWTTSSTISGVSNLFYDASNIRLGVADNTPDHTLDVGGNIGLNASGYINFGDVDGLTGYGFRDNAGSLEYKNSGGAWTTFFSGGGGGGGDVYGTGSDTYIAYWNSSNTITGSSNLVWDYSNTMMGIADLTPDHTLDVGGNIGLTAGNYINWGDTDGTTGYGFWDDGGIIKFKNDGGSWQNFSALAGGDVYGNGSNGQLAFWLTSSTITGTNALFWDNTNAQLSLGADGYDGSLKLFSEQGGTDYEVIFRPHAAMTTSTTYTLPPDAGTNGQYLETDGSGNLTWSSVSSGSGGNVIGTGDDTYIAYWNSSTTITGGSDLVWDYSNTMMGIADPTPDHTLDVGGNIGLSSDGYLNWGDIDGFTGYGFRDNSGTMQFKNNSGTWTNLPTSAGDVYGSGTSGYIAYWNSSKTITGETELFWDETSNRLGIGDATPDHSVDIAGNLGLDADAYINFGDTDGTTGYGIRDNTGTIEYKNSAGSWTAFPTGGNTLDQAYDQGGAGAGKHILADAGTVGIYGSNSGTFTLEITNFSDGGVLWIDNDGSGNALEIDNDGTGNSLLINESTDTYPFVVDASGNVGIGTSSPTAMLEITASGSDALQINPNASSTPANLKFLDASGGEYVGFVAPNVVATNTIWRLPNDDGTNGQVLQTDGSGNLSWSSAAGGGTPGDDDGAVQYNDGGSTFGGDDTQFYWDDTANELGVGTNSPADKLHVEGAVLREGWFMARRSSDQADGGGAATVDWNAQIRSDATYYDHPNGGNDDEIEILLEGWYRISYTINIDYTDGNDRRAVYEIWVEDDGTEIIGSYSSTFAMGDGAHDTPTSASSSFIVDIGANSVLTVEIDCSRGGDNYDIMTNSQITIERIDE